MSVTNVALPAIGVATHSNPSQLQWIVSGYTLAFGLVPIIGGRLGDDHGRRRMFLIGVAGFVLTSAMVGAAPGPELLIVGRILQGLTGGLINPQVSGLVQQMFAGHERGRAFGIMGSVVGLANALGPVVGGALISLGGPHFGWRLVFFINVPIGVVALVLATKWLPAAPPVTRRRKLDLPGAVLLGVATFCVLFPAVEYDALRDPRLAWLLLPAVVLGVVFVLRERRLTREERDPLCDLRMFRESTYTVGVLLALLYFFGFTAIPMVLALYYQQGLGYSALQSGLGVTAFAIGSAFAAVVAGRLVNRLGRQLIVYALLTFTVGAALVDVVVRDVVVSGNPGTGAAVLLIAPLLVVGIGSGGVVSPNQALSLQRVDVRMGSTAGGVLQTAQRIGSAIGQAVIGMVFFASLPRAAADLRGEPRHLAYGSALSNAVRITLIVTVAALLLGIVDLLLTRRRTQHTAETAASAIGGRETP